MQKALTNKDIGHRIQGTGGSTTLNQSDDKVPKGRKSRRGKGEGNEYEEVFNISFLHPLRL